MHQDMFGRRTHAGEKECEQALWGAIQRLTLEQLGQSILDLVSKSASQVRTTTFASPSAVLDCRPTCPVQSQAGSCFCQGGPAILMTDLPSARFVNALPALACLQPG